eukprot:251115-Amorphochlora_amoeboformis.AAC.1
MMRTKDLPHDEEKSESDKNYKSRRDEQREVLSPKNGSIPVKLVYSLYPYLPILPSLLRYPSLPLLSDSHKNRMLSDPCGIL